MKLYEELLKQYGEKLAAFNKNLKTIGQKANRMSYNQNKQMQAGETEFSFSGKTINTALMYAHDFKRYYNIRLKVKLNGESEDDVASIHRPVDLGLILRASNSQYFFETLVNEFDINEQLPHFKTLNFVAVIRPLELVWPDMGEEGYYKAQILIYDLKNGELVKAFVFETSSPVLPEGYEQYLQRLEFFRKHLSTALVAELKKRT